MKITNQTNKKFNNIFKISVFIFFFFICNFHFNLASAATISLNTSKNVFYQQEQFYVDVFVMPDSNEDINSVDLSLSYTSNLTFVKEVDGSSIINLWIEKPVNHDGNISFSGVIPGGFLGLIDSRISDPVAHKKPGLITRLIFEGNKEGDSVVKITTNLVLANDGLGTALPVSSNSLNLSIDKEIIPSVLSLNDITPPEQFLITLSHDPLLFTGKYGIIFETKDKDSGVDFYEVKEKGENWIKAESPYFLSNQPPFGIIIVKAVDRAGNSTISELNIPTSYEPFIRENAWIILVVVISILFFVFLFHRRKSSRVL